MARIDLTIAWNLLNTAKGALSDGDHAGVAGLAAQSAEAAFVHLISEVNGHAPISHFERRERAKELLIALKREVDDLWAARNIDFYGNVQPYGEKRMITIDEARMALGNAEAILLEVERMLDGPDLGVPPQSPPRHSS